MNAAAILEQAEMEGVKLFLSESGNLKLGGDKVQLDKWLPEIKAHKLEIIVALTKAANDPDTTTCFRWLIHLTDREPLQVTFSPGLTRAEVLKRYPDAETAEPMPDTSCRTPTNSESEQLRILIGVVYRDDSPDDRNEAMQSALANPGNGLACYAAIAAERGLIVMDNDDRRFCRKCANLRGTFCTIAQPGGAISARKGYTPCLDILQRCGSFKERGN